jgi:hypothetical protein
LPRTRALTANPYNIVVFPHAPFLPIRKDTERYNEKSVWYLHSSTFQRNMANSLSAVVIDECNFAALLPPHFMRAAFFLFKLVNAYSSSILLLK